MELSTGDDCIEWVTYIYLGNTCLSCCGLSWLTYYLAADKVKTHYNIDDTSESLMLKGCCCTPLLELQVVNEVIYREGLQYAGYKLVKAPANMERV